MAGNEYSGVSDFVANLSSQAAGQSSFLQEIRLQQEHTNKRVLGSAAAIVGGVIAWNAYKAHSGKKNGGRP